jgi:hypothetical protein
MHTRSAHLGLVAAILSQVIMVLQTGAAIALCRSDCGGMAHAELIAMCDTHPAHARGEPRPSAPPAGDSIDALPGTCSHEAMEPSSRRRGDLKPASVLPPPLRCEFALTRTNDPTVGVGMSHSREGSAARHASRSSVLLV